MKVNKKKINPEPLNPERFIFKPFALLCVLGGKIIFLLTPTLPESPRLPKKMGEA